VINVEVSLESGKANVRFDPHKAISEQFKKAVWVMGSEVERVMLGGAEPTESC
jgi:copper chaperone CopZ